MKPKVEQKLPQSKLCERVLELACELEQIPGPTFAEEKRAQWVYTQMQEASLVDVHFDSCGNVLGRLVGRGDRPVVVSAHLDTVFPPHTSLGVTRSANLLHGPGIGDNSLGVAGLIGLAWLLKDESKALPGDVWLAANVGEEGLGNLKGMRGLVDRFGKQALAYIVVEGMGLGEIFHRGLAVRRFRITAQTKGGHSWIDYGKPSAIHELARLAARLTEIPVPREPRSSFNIGVFQGGTGVNTIAAQAYMEVDLRSVSIDSLNRMTRELKHMVEDTSSSDVECQVEPIGERPAGEIPSDHPLVSLAYNTLHDLGVKPHPGIGSTDANIPISRGYPAICIGLTSGGGAHTTEEFIRTGPLAYGLAQVREIVMRVWDVLG
jgi:acetylornithine deacetylase/succinyl-diaminopimelate desuccinylase-like protein